MPNLPSVVLGTGFRDTRNGFEIYEHVLGRDGWTEGFITQEEAMLEIKE